MPGSNQPTPSYTTPEETLTPPGRATEDDDVVFANKSLDDVEAVPSVKDYLFSDSINLCVVFRAFHRLGILLDSEDLFPPVRTRKSNGVAAYSCESVDNDSFVLGSSLCDMYCYLAARFQSFV